MEYYSISMSNIKRDRKNRSNLSICRGSLLTGSCNDKDQKNCMQILFSSWSICFSQGHGPAILKLCYVLS